MDECTNAHDEQVEAAEDGPGQEHDEGTLVVCTHAVANLQGQRGWSIAKVSSVSKNVSTVLAHPATLLTFHCQIVTLVGRQEVITALRPCNAVWKLPRSNALTNGQW